MTEQEAKVSDSNKTVNGFSKIFNKLKQHDDENSEERKWLNEILEIDGEINDKLIITPDEIKKEIELILGETEEWSSNSEEFLISRETIRNASHFQSTEIDQMKYFPLYLDNSPINPILDPNQKLVIKIKYKLSDGKLLEKMFAYNPNMTVNEFTEMILTKFNNLKQEDGFPIERKKEDFIYKAVDSGRVHYLYGDYKMVDFEYIRKYMKTRPILTLLDKEMAKSEIDPLDLTLKTISYDFKYENGQNNQSQIEEDCLNLWDLTENTRVEIVGVDNLNSDSKDQVESSYLYVCCELFYGGIPLSRPQFTRMIPFNKSPQWNEFLEFKDTFLSDLPREVTISFTIFSREITDKENQELENAYCVSGRDTPLGHVVVPLFNFMGLLKQGEYHSIIWPNGRANPCSVPHENIGAESPISISYRFNYHSKNIIFPKKMLPTRRMEECFDSFEQGIIEYFKELTHEQQMNRIINEIITKDSLQIFTQEEAYLVWSNRESLVEIPKALPKFILSVPWKFPKAIQITHSLLYKWKPIDPLDALELLSYKFTDSTVRQYAIERLDGLDDSQLSYYLLQLVQSLKHELYHDSSLARFLLQRGLASRNDIGHFLFWYLKSEMHQPPVQERNRLILNEYLSHSGKQRRELMKQVYILDQLEDISIQIKQETKENLKPKFKELINNIKQPKKYKLPLSPYMETSGLILDKCRTMDNRYRSLWLCFENLDEDGDDFLVLFKSGKDLSSYQLILQTLRYMDQLWKKEGLDMHMNPYSCISTGSLNGMIQVVRNSKTIADIIGNIGGRFTFLKPDDEISNWLKNQNMEQDMDSVIDNFVYSCAGYCSATYVLGIGDRHNDNIMLTKYGALFHTEFNNIMRHSRLRSFIHRETPPFVFTEIYSNVMGGEKSEKYEKFCELGCRAYSILCKHGKSIITLFTLMLGSGIPNMSSIESISWLKTSLLLSASTTETDEHFLEKIDESKERAKIRFSTPIFWK